MRYHVSREAPWVERQIAELKAAKEEKSKTETTNSTGQHLPCASVVPASNSIRRTVTCSPELRSSVDRGIPRRTPEQQPRQQLQYESFLVSTDSPARPPTSKIHYDDQIASAATTAAVSAIRLSRHAGGLFDIEQMRRALVEAEKRSDWLRGELNMLTACATEQVQELKQELAEARKQNKSGIAAAATTSAVVDGTTDDGAAATRSRRDEDGLVQVFLPVENEEAENKVRQI